MEKDTFQKKDRKARFRWIAGAILLSFLGITILAVLFHERILLQAGRFMAPEEIGAAEVAILEGGQIVETGAVVKGVRFLSSGRAARLIVVVHRISEKAKSFGLPEDYPRRVKNELKGLGLKEEQYEVIVTPAHHPITLTEAEWILGALSKEGVRSAILLSNGFHTRRSFLVYRQVAIPLKIKIIPAAYFNEYQLDRWWVQDLGMHDFLAELFKLAYYQIRGLIPLNFSD